MRPIHKYDRRDGIIELEVEIEKRFLYFFTRTYTVTYYGRKSAVKGEDMRWTDKKGRTVPANTGEILTVLSDFFRVE